MSTASSSLPADRSGLTKLVISLLLAAGFVWLLRQGELPMMPDSSALSSVKPWFAPVYALLMALCIVPRTVRWKYLLRPLGQVPARTLTGVSLLGFGFAVFAPLRMGELARPYLLSRRTSITFLQATSTAIAERVLDGLYLSVILLGGLLFAPPRADLPDHIGKIPLNVAAIPRAAYGALALFACAFATLAVFYAARERAKLLCHAVFGLVSPRLASWVVDKLEHVADGLRFLPSAQSGLPFLAHTALYWLVCVLIVWAGLLGCGLDATLAQSCVVLGVTGLGILIPSGPALFGTYQLATFCSLALFFPEETFRTSGASYVFLTYVIQNVINLLGMAAGGLMLRSRDG